MPRMFSASYQRYSTSAVGMGGRGDAESCAFELRTGPKTPESPIAINRATNWIDPTKLFVFLLSIDQDVPPFARVGQVFHRSVGASCFFISPRSRVPASRVSGSSF